MNWEHTPGPGFLTHDFFAMIFRQLYKTMTLQNILDLLKELKLFGIQLW